MSAANEALVRESFEAIGRGDAEWIIEHADPEIELHMVGVAGEPVLYRGHDGIREWLADMYEIWETIEFVAEAIHDRDDRVLAIVTMRYRGRASGLEVEAKAGLVNELRNGRAVLMRAYPGVVTLADLP